MFRIIQGGFDKREFRQNLLAKRSDTAGNGAFQLAEGCFSGIVVPGTDQIHHRFRFRQINPAI